MAVDVQPVGSCFTIPRQGRTPARECAFPFPFAIVSGDQAEQALAEIAKTKPGMTPIILGEPESAANVLDAYEGNRDLSPDAISSQASRLDVDKWLAERPGELWGDEDDIPELPMAGSWPGNVEPTHTLSSVRDLGNGRPLRQVVIALLPTAEPSETAAHLKFGGWNDCPDPEVNVAFARRWRERYGARPVACTGDVLEFRVEKPVATREDALRLAKEQYFYCADIVDQGAETIERLAAALLGSTAWFFWWD